MRTIVLIAVLGAIGVSPFFLAGAAEADERPPQVPDRCSELQLEIEEGDLGPVSEWPTERILLGLLCARLGDPGPTPLIPGVDVPGIEAIPLTHVDQRAVTFR